MPNLLKFKRGLVATIPTASLAEPLFTTDTYDLYIGNGTSNTRFQKYIASGTSAQFLKGDGSLDSTSYQTSLTFSSPLVNTSGTISIPVATSSANGYLSSTDWSTFNSKEPAITASTTAKYYRGDKTFQTLDTAAVPENGSIYFTEPRVLATVLTGLNLTGGGTIAATDSVLAAFGKVQNQISALVGGATYQGTWNASTNSPTLASGTGTKGFYYVVNVAGSTNLDGITDWKVGDWAIFNGTTWDKVDNTDAVSSVNGFTGAVNLGLGDISNVALSSPTNAQLLYFNGTSSKWENWTPTFEPALTKGNLTEATSSVLTISGGSNAVIGSGTSIQVKQSSGSQSGYLSSTDWTTFNNKQAALTNPVTGTGTNNEIAYFNSTGSTIASLSTATYPSLTELSYVKGVTSAIQTQLNAKEPTVTKGNLTEATSSVLTISNGTGAVIGSGTSIQVKLASGSQSGYLSSTDWTTFNNKQNALTNPVTGTGTNNQIAYFNATGSTIASLSTATYPSLTELSYVKGVTSAIQTQIDGKQASGNYATTDTNQTISGKKTFSTQTDFSAAINLLNNQAIYLYNAGSTFSTGLFSSTALSANRTIYFPNAGGTVALTSDLSSYLPLSGGTLTGALSGTSATFSGNVVLGTTALSGGGAAQWLTANGTAYGGGFISSVNGVAKAYYYYDNGGYAYVQGESGAGVRLVVNSSTNALTIASTGAATFSSSVTATSGLFNGYTSGLPPTSGSATRGGLRLNNASNIAFDFGTVAAGQAWIQISDANNYASNFALLLNPNGGNVGIGTSSPASGRKLDVAGSIRSYAYDVTYNSSISGYLLQEVEWTGVASTNLSLAAETGNAITFFTNGSGSERMRITSGGELWVGYTADQGAYIIQANGAVQAASGFFDTSDIRLKNVLSTIESINISAINYTWKDGRNDKKHWGYSAQDVMKILPDAVEGSEDKFYTVNYNEVHTWKIAQLENKIKELEAKLSN